MFKDCGPKIKLVATIFFWVCAALCIVLACVTGFAKEYDYYGYREHVRTVFLPVPFFSILIGGCLFSYVGALIVYGFGEIVEKVTAIDKKLKSDESISKSFLAEEGVGNEKVFLDEEK